MAPNNKTITVAPVVDIDNQQLLRLVGDFYLPGEQVRLDGSTEFISEAEGAKAARMAAFGDRLLTIAETRLDPIADNAGTVFNYVFEGIEGRHNAKAFIDPRPFEHSYGMIITRQGNAWFVPFKRDAGAGDDVAGPVRKLSPVLPRSAHYCFGLGHPDLLAHGQFAATGLPQGEIDKLAGTYTPANFFADLEAEPSTGEFVLYRPADDDGDWTLAYAPWTSGASPEEIARAELAIDAEIEVRHAASPGPGVN